jgi:hypothetical protein
MPNGAKSQTAPNGGAVPLFVAVRDFALSGIPRCLGFRAVWDLAPFGISRRSAPAPFQQFAVCSTRVSSGRTLCPRHDLPASRARPDMNTRLEAARRP